MKTLVLTITLTLSLINAVNAGLDKGVRTLAVYHNVADSDLDSNDTFNPVIAVYHFGSVKQNDLVKYTEDSGPRYVHGALLEGAALSNKGKSGKCLQLQNKATFAAATLSSPTLADSKFSIVAWVKLPPQEDETVVNLTMIGHNRADKAMLSVIAIGITPSGNLKARHENLLAGIFVALESENQNVSDNKWHHIAFSKSSSTLRGIGDTYRLFIDGKIVATEHSTKRPRFLGDLTSILIGTISNEMLIDEVLVDDVAFFEAGACLTTIREIYNNGLSAFVEPYCPTSRETNSDVGEIKSQ